MPPFLNPVERLILIRDGFYSPDARCHTRASALLAIDRGHSVRSVARSVRCSRDSLYRWYGQYLENRDVAALGDGRSRAARRRARGLAADRTAALLELAETAARPADAPGRLDIDGPDRAALRRVADGREPNAKLFHRYWAALLLAFDRGVPVATIARTAGTDRSTVYKAPARHLARVLATAE